MDLVLPFQEESEIPDRYTQYGQNMSPSMNFHEVPDKAEALIVIMEDIDAPESLKTHWVIWNIPPDSELEEGIPVEGEPGNGMVQGNNDYKVIGYMGPKYFADEEKYRFIAYALESELNLEPGERREQAEDAMRGKVLDKSTFEAGRTW